MNKHFKFYSIICFLFLPFIVYSQKWTYKSGGNEFDGKYKVAYVVGTGGEFPYNTPKFYINYFIESKDINVYITDGGYSGCDNKIIFVKFNGDELKYSFSSSSDDEKDTWFFNDDYKYGYSSLSIVDLLEKMKINSTIYVRLKSDCGQTDYKFTLSGSTAAINYVANDYIMENRKKEADKLQKDKEDEVIREQKIIDKEKLEQQIKSGAKIKARTAYACSILSEPKSSALFKTLTKDEEVTLTYYSDEYFIILKATSYELPNDTLYLSKYGIDKNTIELVE